MSSPPFMFTTRFSLVPMSMLNGAGVVRSNRTRVPLGVTVNVSAPLPPLTSTVSMPSPPSFRSVPSPGFQIIRSLPPSPKTWSLPVPPVRTSLPSPPNSKSSPPLPRSVSFPAWPKSRSLPEPPVSVSLPAPPKRFAAGSAPLASSRARMSLPPRPNTWIRLVFATVAVPPTMDTAPPLTRIVPAASRLTVTLLSRLSPRTVSTPAPGEKTAVTAGVIRHSSNSRTEGRAARRVRDGRRRLR